MINYYISIVLYKYIIDDILKFLEKIHRVNSNYIIYLIDNSNIDNTKYFKECRNTIYVKTESNIGFGKGHNITINQALINNITYCFILNYDITFEESVFNKLIEYLDSHNDVAMIMPKILNKNKSPQRLPKLQPDPLSVVKRKINQVSKNYLFKKFISEYELRNINFAKNYNISNLSGCFFLLNIKMLKKEALFDERFFLYFEDYDLSRRIASKYKTVLFNQSYIIHDYQSAANKNLFMLLIFIRSYFKYFNKWGWFKTKNLTTVNNKIFAID